MLQIVTGMYFRDVRLNETTHRRVYFTNASSLSRAPIELPIGRFLLGTAHASVNSVTIEAVERLEAVRPDGTDDFHIATGGMELLDDVADVFAFGLNVSCSGNAALIERLVPDRIDGRSIRGPSGTFRRTFDPSVVVTEVDIADLEVFTTELLALRRSHFEAAMRSIRSVVNATLLASDDPALAYTLFVAALETLAQTAMPVGPTRGWDSYPNTRRKVIDAAIGRGGLDQRQTDLVRDAVLQIDHLSLLRRFVNFTLDQIEPRYYRAEAADASRPIRSCDLPNALDVAYQLRSSNVHELKELAPELWAITDRADTLRWEGRSVLSLEGMNRLCRHVIRSFVSRSPKDLDPSFDYRKHLPGIVKVQIAPQYWIWQEKGLSLATAPAYFEGFLDVLVEALADPQHKFPADLTNLFESIEKLLPGLAKPRQRLPLLGMYVLWNRLVPVGARRPRADAIMQRFASDLDQPTAVGFAVGLLTAPSDKWTLGHLRRLVDERRQDLPRGKGQPLPTRFDAALLALTGTMLCEAGRTDEGARLLSEAVEMYPGSQFLLDAEEAAMAGTTPSLDLYSFVLGVPAPDTSAASAARRSPPRSQTPVRRQPGLRSAGAWRRGRTVRGRGRQGREFAKHGRTRRGPGSSRVGRRQWPRGRR